MGVYALAAVLPIVAVMFFLVILPWPPSVSPRAGPIRPGATGHTG